MDVQLKDKLAVICGSTQGIGYAVAYELAVCGASCILIARNEVKLKAAVESLPRSHGQVHEYRQAEFSDVKTVEMVATALAASHRVHILINNTGGPAAGPIANAAVAEFRQAFDQHLICNHILLQAFLPGMKEAGFGRIINIISTSVKIPLPNLGVSNTIRGAVASWAKTMANELGSFGITVNNVLPGATETQRLDNIIRLHAEKAGTDRDQVAMRMQKDIPAGRFGTAAEIANVAVFLATPAAAYVNGVSIPVDGGRTGSL